MQATIPYSELCQIVAEKFHKKIQLAPVNESTLAVTIKLKAAFITLSPTLDVTVDEACGTTMALTYDGGFGVDMIMSGALTFLKNKVEGISELVEIFDKNIIVHLEKIKELQTLLEYLRLDGIAFDDKAVILRLAPTLNSN